MAIGVVEGEEGWRAARERPGVRVSGEGTEKREQWPRGRD